MSAAQPADPTRPYVDSPENAAVISLTKRRNIRSGGTLQAARGRWNMNTPPADNPPPPTPGGKSPLEVFADDIETSFNAINQSLTKPDTVAAYLLTLDVWERALQGSHATGIIDGEQLDELLGVLRGMREAPGLI